MNKQTIAVGPVTNYRFGAGDELASLPGTGPLNRQETATLLDCEKVIEKGQETFLEVGAALVTIRQEKLYRYRYGTFDEYCRERWGWTARRAGQLASSSEVIKNLLEAREPKEDEEEPPRVHSAPMPTTERQVRPLSRLPKEEQPEAWEAAVKAAPNGKVRGEDVEREVRQRLAGPQRLTGAGTETPQKDFALEMQEAPKRTGNIESVVVLLRGIMTNVGAIQALLEVEKDESGLAWLKSLTESFSLLLNRYTKLQKTPAGSFTGGNRGNGEGAQDKADAKSCYVICREPYNRGGKSKYAPGWCLDPRKASTFTKQVAKQMIKELGAYRWDKVLSLAHAVRRFEKGL